jgi:hypothetical protein
MLMSPSFARWMLVVAPSVAFGVLVACGGSFSSGDDTGGADATPDASMTEDVTGGADAPRDGKGFEAQLPDVFDEVPPACNNGFACVPGQPIGWQQSDGWNLYEIHRDSFPGDGGGPTCDTHFAPVADLNADFADAGAQCTCGCAPPSDPCPLTQLLLHQNPQCGDSPCAALSVQNGACFVQNDNCGATAAGMELVPPTPAGCTPDASTALLAPFGSTARACVSQYAPGTSDCEAGSVCQPVPSSSFDSKLCVGTGGDKACPPQTYTKRQLLYQGFQDDRACSGCTCGPGLQQCSGSFHLYQACPNAGMDYGQFTSCAGVNQAADYAITATSAVTGSVACNPTGGVPQGGVMPSGAFTLCCMP